MCVYLLITVVVSYVARISIYVYYHTVIGTILSIYSFDFDFSMAEVA
jgi:hypothetical protein